jgi:hypothetical protein
MEALQAKPKLKAKAIPATEERNCQHDSNSVVGQKRKMKK